MTYADRLAALHPTARTILAASRAAATCAANDDAGLSWHERDRAPFADDSHTSALVLSRSAAVILGGLCREVEPRVDLWWRISPELPTATGPRVGVVGHGHDEATALRAVERDARAVLRGHLAWLVAWERGSAEQAAGAWASVRAAREVVAAVDGERIIACDSAHLQYTCR